MGRNADNADAHGKQCWWQSTDAGQTEFHLRDCTKMSAFNQISQSAVYRQGEVCVSLTCCGGSYGGAVSV